ncbi:tripartite tricarboxylate transporter TctB family protein [Citricoccus sp.]|uniref:tripartite tricarboxylate transporter TctB family protein n=1 Tax=Citricoccus sp. TaxID=1978372 RepID=UPI0028BEFF96|nr:tripartite tricarboxylate transporter TctB family protein [Citricoccus sp.]
MMSTAPENAGRADAAGPGTEPESAPSAGPADHSDLHDPAEPADLTPEELAEKWAAEGPPPAGPMANAAASLVVLALGVLGVIVAVGLGVGDVTNPDAGTWPLAVSVLICALALAQLVVGRHGGADGEKFTRYSAITFVGFLTLIGMVILVPLLGFEVPSLALCIIWMRFLGGESWRSALLYSVIVVAAFYAIFIAALGTSIPHLI